MSQRSGPKRTWTKEPRPWRRWATTWLAITGLLGLLVMPMVGVADGADGVTLITACTDDGPTVIALDGTGRSVPVPQHHHGTACPFCTSHAGYAAIPQQQPVLFQTAFGSIHRLTLPVGVVPKDFFLTGCQSRAPPLLAT